MTTTIRVNPLTRVEGHLNIETSLEGSNSDRKVAAAKTSGSMFRGFEVILCGRDPRDAPHITERICGVCPVSHAMAASMALEAACEVAPADNGRILRNLVLGADYLHSHILHFYQLALPDYVDLADQIGSAPWTPSYRSRDMLCGAKAANLVKHYVEALTIRRKAHQMGAIFGGRLPHSPALVPGGCSQPLPSGASTTRKIAEFRKLLDEIRTFVAKVYLPDVKGLTEAFPDYFAIGRGCGTLLAFGAFDLDSAGRKKLFRRGCSSGGPSWPLDVEKLSEQVGHSRYAAADGSMHPASGTTKPDITKAGAYSWIKSPRYEDGVYEVGPLARMWINGDYRRGISVMDRLMARALETQKIADAMAGWLDQLQPGSATVARVTYPASGTGAGLTEAPRGALGHWTRFRNGAIEHYQVITPTAWNASPRDNDNHPGPIEQALVGAPVANPDEPVELVRVVHSFDPCTGCSVH